MPKNLYKRAGVWWAEKVFKGKRYRFSLETESLREAQKRFDAKVAELTATHWGEKPRRTFDEASLRFVDEHLPTLKPKSAKRYLVSLGQLAEIFEGKKLDEIGSALLYEFEQTRYRAGAAKPTIRRDLACLSSLLSFAMTLEWIAQNPVPAYLKARSKKGLKEGEPRMRYLDHDEENRLSSAIRRAAQDAARNGRGKNSNPRFWLDFLENVIFAIETGLRKEEQFGLMRHHIDFKRQELIVDQTVAKSGHERRVPLLPRAMEITRQRALNATSPYLFPAADGSRYSEKSNYMLKKLKAIAAKAKIKDLIWHDLRRTCGCRLLQDHRMSMDRVSRWLGHSSVTVTEKSYAFLRVEDLHQSIRESNERTRNGTNVEGQVGNKPND